jgi:hypothetical protein
VADGCEASHEPLTACQRLRAPAWIVWSGPVLVKTRSLLRGAVSRSFADWP